MTHKVFFSPEAQKDLIEIYSYIATHSYPARALAYIERLESFCLAFSTFPERTARRDDLRRGLRVAGFEKRVTIAFHIQGRKVIIDRLLYGGRSFQEIIEE